MNLLRLHWSFLNTLVIVFKKFCRGSFVLNCDNLYYFDVQIWNLVRLGSHLSELYVFELQGRNKHFPNENILAKCTTELPNGPSEPLDGIEIVAGRRQVLINCNGPPCQISHEKLVTVFE